MLLALQNGKRVSAAPAIAGAVCPSCRADVIAKCGAIKIWHWAHVAAEECDPWAEGESHWHSGWKLRFPEEYREVVKFPHRADLCLSNGWVIELQHSSISAGEIREREVFYGRMVWVIDASEFIDNFIIYPKQWNEFTWFAFRWKWPRRSWENAQRPVFLDVGREYTGVPSLFRIKKTHWRDGASARGWGKFVDQEYFVSRGLASGMMPATAMAV